ncbi:uncharacterized protein LOC128555980 [Mercenaria mercenaria]|uniref:uncharacterized protein LOC128555980 n=1 Tax=Mercenaria mercenaria TaxID=6596 RepID=UPI00234EED16|nr:uncharacterized protein LOC128555980 [Mercenaria mercenaria]
MRAIYIVNIWLACAVSCSAVFGFIFNNSPKLHNGTLIPLDPDVCTSQNITFTCTLLSTPNPSSSIGFAVKNESTNREFLPVDEGRITVINETSSEFKIYNINATTYFFVRCYYWETFGNVDDTSKQLGYTSTASVYRKHLKIDSLKLHNGTLVPLDPDVCTSQNITFTCTLLSTPNPSSSIGFAVKNESTNKEFLPVDEGRITVINETSSEFKIYNINATTYFFVRCYYWETFGNVDDTSKQLGNTSTASVYLMPEKVGHMDCIVKNYIDSMRCSWNYGDKYKSGQLPDVEFQWYEFNLC